jgi:hypothetical protein
MVKLGRSRVACLVLVISGALLAGSASFGTSAADAGPLEGLAGPVREATESVEEIAGGVVQPVQEVTEHAPPVVTEVTETVTPPVTEVTESVAPPVEKVTQTVVPPVAKVTETVTKTVAPPVVEATRSVTPTVKEVSETGARASREATADANAPVATTPTRGPSVTTADPSGGPKPSTRGVEGEPGTATGAAGADATAKATSGGDGLRADRFAAPSPDGSIRAPLPKWMAYVWPAIALAWPELAAFIDRWERDGASLLLASDAGPTGSHGVAAAHASHGGSAASGSSSPLAPIPDAISGFTSHVPGEALAYLAIVALLVAAVFFAVKFELSHRGRGSN